MREFAIGLLIVVVLVGCKQRNYVNSIKGYAVYLLPDKIRFVETKGMVDTNYVKNFSTSNFGNAISFKPNCEIGKIIENIKPDTLFDENPELKEFTTFMKYPLVFPAEIKILDTAVTKQKDLSDKKFKMIYKGNLIEFSYSDFTGAVVDLKRINN